MEVIPAIDIRDGRCVRLYQGNYARESVYSNNPAEVAARWVHLGAARLHVVDLDGAREGLPANLREVESILSSVSVPVQLGGGIRSLEVARSLLSKGVQRVMIGTAAATDQEMLKSIGEQLGYEAVVISVDARDGLVAVKGWTQSSGILAPELVSQLAGLGFPRFMYTDIGRDGTLAGPNFPAIKALIHQVEVKFLVAGGISSVVHLQQLEELGVEGAVVGKALYTGDLDLQEAIQSVGGPRI